MGKLTLRAMPYNPNEDYEALAALLIEDRYHTGNISGYMTYREHKELMLDLLRKTPTQDMLLFDDDKVIGAYCATVVQDCHYGTLMMPVVCYIHSDYRGNLGLTRALAVMERSAAELLEVKRYYRITHKGNGVTEYKLKEVRNGRNRKISN